MGARGASFEVRRATQPAAAERNHSSAGKPRVFQRVAFVAVMRSGRSRNFAATVQKVRARNYADSRVAVVRLGTTFGRALVGYPGCEPTADGRARGPGSGGPGPSAESGFMTRNESSSKSRLRALVQRLPTSSSLE